MPAHCPECKTELPDTFIVRENARLNGLKGGRPRSRKQRCPCGQMTLKRAVARAHKCH